ncbi:hypothetical protein NUSPORA_01721 [Nucleospora cyclopteri]
MSESKEFENNSEESVKETVEKAREVKKTLFYDIGLYKDKEVTVFLYNGNSVSGILTDYDEVANCLLRAQEKEFFIFGRSITMICEGITMK